ncbi:MAG: M24 family metallopeptidase [Candidatus Heimdallarchaeota archaeon]
MKSDLDNLMDEKDIDCIVIFGRGISNPPMAYMAKGAQFQHTSYIVKKHNEEAILFHTAMERDSVLETGLTLRINHEAIPDYFEISKSEQDAALLQAKLLKSLLISMGIEGTVSFHGMAGIGQAYKMVSFLREKTSIKVFQDSDDILQLARQTKDSEEIDRIEQVANTTGKVLSEVRSFLGTLHEEEGYAMRPDGKKVSLGEVKDFIRFELFKQGLVEDHPTIFSMGRDAGVPHNEGNPNDLLQTGKPIIMDIFPCEPNGYFFDCTRTFCLGYIPPEVESLYLDVLEVQKGILNDVAIGIPHGELIAKACTMFEQKDHPTPRIAPGAAHGFCHGLGHGIGLEIHENPSIGIAKLEDKKSITRIGEVFTVEPGLYYPERGIGVRLEDVVAITDDGVKNLSPFPKDLLIPLKG